MFTLSVYTEQSEVPKRGLEPPILTEHGSEPCASTISPLRQVQAPFYQILYNRESLLPGLPGQGRLMVGQIAWYIYILESLKDKSHYIGISSDPKRRLEEHNSGKSLYTKRKRPWIIIYTETYDDLKKAREREKYLKSYRGSREKLTIIEHCPVV